MGGVKPHTSKVVAKCPCPGCVKLRAYKNEYDRRRYKHRTPPQTELVNAKLPLAKAFLDDGASYAEAALSAGIKAETLRRRLPGYGANFSQANSMFASIKYKPDLLSLHREIWQGPHSPA